MFIITAFILGMLVALNPCQLAINTSALTYISQHCRTPQMLRQKAILYALGRIVTYSVLGIVLMAIWEKSAATDSIQTLLSKGEMLLPYIFIIIGVFMLYRVFRHHDHHGDNCHHSGQTIRRNGASGAFILGLMLAFAFCPESAVIYFAMMMPIAVSHTWGALVPVVFAVASILPVLLIAYLLTQAGKKVKAFNLRFKNFQRITNAAIGILFIVAAIILILQ